MRNSTFKTRDYCLEMALLICKNHAFFTNVTKMSEILNFSVTSCSAWAESCSLPTEWAAWARQENFESTESTESAEAAIDISAVPAMKRRRMSQLSKMAFHSALKCVEVENYDINCVFASQHGELHRTVKILKSLADSGEVSPTDFSMSVHNTALGLYSILTKNKNPATSIAAGEDSFGFGMLEACNFLHRHPDKPVLLVYFDEPLPEPLEADERQNHISIALLLESSTQGEVSINQGNSFSLELQPNSTNDKTSDTLPMSFLRFYFGEKQSCDFYSDRYSWRWKK